MAKELPFFKFNATEWITGNISYESYELQGVFIKLCAEYWNRSNKLTKEDAIKRLKEPKLIEELIKKGYIKQKRKQIKINFLDTEREQIEAKYLKLRESGRKGGLSTAAARLKHKDKDKDKDKEVEKIPTFEEFKKHALSKKSNLDLDALKLKYEAWVENGWKNGNHKKIKNWKTALTNTIPYIKTLSNSSNIQQPKNLKDLYE